MIPALIPENEIERLQSLYSYDILDTSEEEEYNDLINMAAVICQCPISLITFIDRNRQWFKARRNLDAESSPREVSFCAHAILQEEVFEVPDATKDERFFDNPDVKGGLSVRFYAGAPVKSSSGHNLGTLCVIDTKPKKMSTEQQQALKQLARQVARLLELRLMNKKLQTRNRRLINNENSYQQFFKFSPVPLFVFTATDKRIRLVNKAAMDLYGYTNKEIIDMPIGKMFADRAEEKSLLETLQSRNAASALVQQRNKNGTVMLVQLSLLQLTLEQRNVVLATAVDLSEKMLLQKTLERQRSMLRKLKLSAEKAKEEERKFLAAELHDNVNQMLASTFMYLDFVSDVDEITRQLIEKSKKNLNSAVDEIRQLSHSMMGKRSKTQTLKSIVSDVTRSYLVTGQFTIDFSLPSSSLKISTKTLTQLKRILQEQLQNISRHAKARHVRISIREKNGLVVEISDDGIGFDIHGRTEGLGIRSIEERAKSLGGTSRIVSEPGKGTKLTVNIPQSQLSTALVGRKA